MVMRILAIETSCDDTGIAILEYKTSASQPKILANLVSSQTKIHAPWGGVVPMLAKREHQKNLIPLLKQALKDAELLTINNKQSTINNPNLQSKLSNLKSIFEREPELLKNILPFLNKYQKPAIDAIAVTIGPGLEPALWVGVNLARALACFWSQPLIAVNHVAGHLAAALAVDGQSRAISNKNIILPAIALVASGGHTQLIFVKKFGDYKIVGETRDDAAGEAFDKVAKMLNLGYPGGPAVAKIANFHKSDHKSSQINISEISGKSVRISHIKLPRPMINSGDFDFSFSGLKTAVLYTLQKMTRAEIKRLTPAIAAEFQQAIIDVLVAKTLAAAKKYRAASVLLCGGVAANKMLRQALAKESTRAGLLFGAPPVNFCTDNAVMIALATAHQPKQKPTSKATWRYLKAQANLRIS